MIDGKQADLSSFKQQVLSVAKDLNVELTRLKCLLVRLTWLSKRRKKSGRG